MVLLLPVVPHCQDKLLLDNLHSHDRPQEDHLSRCRCLPRLVVHTLERLLRPYNHLDHMLLHLDKDRDTRLHLHRRVHMLHLLANNSSSNLSSLVGCTLLPLVLELDHYNLHLQVQEVPKLRRPLVLKKRDLRHQSILLVTAPIFLTMQGQRTR